MPNPFDIRPATAADRPAILALLAQSLGWGDDERYVRFFAWKHDENPFGASPAWLAVDGDTLLGVRVFLRWEFTVGDTVVRAVRAVDTATAPEARGRGVFTALTMHALRELAGDGVTMVFNTPNAQSRPGYLKMGWRVVGRPRVQARVRSVTTAPTLRRARVAADKWTLTSSVGVAAADRLAGHAPAPGAGPADDGRLRTRATADFLRWRYGSALLGYRVVEHDDAAVVVRTRRRGAAVELTVATGLTGARGAQDAAVVAALRACRADYALRSGPAGLRHGFVPLPGAGPVLTWRGLDDGAMPTLDRWALELGDLELM